MTVYVDDPIDYGRGVHGVARRYGTVWSHLIADSEAELCAFADRLGLRQSWIQHAGSYRVHFDVTPARRRQALELGAEPMALREIIRRRRAAI